MLRSKAHVVTNVHTTLQSAIIRSRVKGNALILAFSALLVDLDRLDNTWGIRGLPPGFTAKVEARLAETEAALFHVLSEIHAYGPSTGQEITLEGSPSVRLGNQSKADRVREWESLPLRSRSQIDAWFRWKSGAGQEQPQEMPARDSARYEPSHGSRLQSSCQIGDAPSFGGLQSSPDYMPPAGSPAASKTSTGEEVYSGRVKNLSESQRNMYF